MKLLAPVTPAQLSSPGLARTSATSSFSELAGEATGTVMPTKVLETRAIGARSSGLYGRLSCRNGCAMNDGGRRQQQDVIVLGADEGVDGDDAVAAGLVLDHDRLAPFLGQPVGQKPPADVGAAAGAERQDEADRPRRPSSARLSRAATPTTRPRSERHEMASSGRWTRRMALRLHCAEIARSAAARHAAIAGPHGFSAMPRSLAFLAISARWASIDLRELLRPAGSEKLRGGVEPILDDGVVLHHLLDVGGDPLAQRHRHGRRAEQPDQPVDGQRRLAGLRHGRNVGIDRRAGGVDHGEKLDVAGLKLRLRDRNSRIRRPARDWSRRRWRLRPGCGTAPSSCRGWRP